jgi:hypothetical protein
MLTRLVAAVAVALGATDAGAALLTFDNLANDSPGLWGVEVGPDVYERGYVIRSCSGRCGASNLVVYSRTDPKQADPGHATLVPNYVDLTLTLSREDGQAFDFNSIDIADTYNVASFSTRVVFEFIRAGQPTETAVALVTVASGLQHFEFNEAGVTAVRFYGTGSGGIGQIDNVMLDALPVAEPGSVAAAALSLAALALTRNRRRLSAAPLPP